MINLLPIEVKQNYLYARRNTHLVRWAIALVTGIIGIAIVVGFGQLYLNSSINNYAKQANETRTQLKAQKLDETQARITEVGNNLKLAVQVLSKQILFSKLIQQIGAATPSGATLTNLSITKLEGGIDLEFEAINYQTGTQIQVNLQDPANNIFDKADIISIACGTLSSSDPKYPCQVTIRAAFSKNNNRFLFIAPTTTSGVKP